MGRFGAKSKRYLAYIARYIQIFFNHFTFFWDYFQFHRQSNPSRFILKFRNIYPCLRDATSNTPFDRHYIYHTAWAARIIARTKPEEHVDISSILYFPVLISAFIPVKYYDFRPPELSLLNLESGQADLTDLQFPDNSIASLSCMHTVEHIGLGRYGDPIDPDGDLKAIRELIRVLKIGGNLLFVVPVGKEAKIMFNAHRIYTYSQIIEYFSLLQLKEFSLIPEIQNIPDFIENADPSLVNQCSYGCGCFWFRKK